jgi:hypothetical protein
MPIDMKSFMMSYLLATEWKTWFTSGCFWSVGTEAKPKWLSYFFEEQRVEGRRSRAESSDWRVIIIVIIYIQWGLLARREG